MLLAPILRIEFEFFFLVMGVVEKSDGAEVAVEAEIEWGLVDNEIQLLQTLCQTSRPIGKLCVDYTNIDRCYDYSLFQQGSANTSRWLALLRNLPTILTKKLHPKGFGITSQPCTIFRSW